MVVAWELHLPVSNALHAIKSSFPPFIAVALLLVDGDESCPGTRRLGALISSNNKSLLRPGARST